jgi:hypothetical protein
MICKMGLQVTEPHFLIIKLSAFPAVAGLFQKPENQFLLQVHSTLAGNI